MLSFAHVGMLALQIPALESRPAWFWLLRVKPTPAAWLAVPALCAVGLVGRASLGAPRLRPVHLVGLAAAGLAVSLTAAAVEGRGLAPLTRNLVASGHAEFVNIAAGADIRVVDVVARYEELLDEADMSFPRSKGPGQLLSYIALERVACFDLAPADHVARLARFRAVLMWLFPILTTLVVLPLAALTRDWLGPNRSAGTILLVLLAPNAALVTMHLDGVVYPALALAVLVCASLAVRTWHAGWAVLAGLLYWVCSYISFSLLPVGVLALAPLLPALRGPGRDLHAFGRVGFAAAAGALCPLLLLRVFAGYDVLERFSAAMTFHAGWKHLPPAVSTVDIAVTNLIEWAVWIGLPLAGAQVVGTVMAVRRLREGRGEAIDALAVMLPCLLLALSLQHGTAGETARLWLFLLAPSAMVAMYGLSRPDGDNRPLVAVLGLQVVILMFTKKFQDFF